MDPNIDVTEENCPQIPRIGEHTLGSILDRVKLFLDSLSEREGWDWWDAEVIGVGWGGGKEEGAQYMQHGSSLS